MPLVHSRALSPVVTQVVDSEVMSSFLPSLPVPIPAPLQMLMNVRKTDVTRQLPATIPLAPSPAFANLGISETAFSAHMVRFVGPPQALTPLASLMVLFSDPQLTLHLAWSGAFVDGVCKAPRYPLLPAFPMTSY